MEGTETHKAIRPGSVEELEREVETGRLDAGRERGQERVMANSVRVYLYNNCGTCRKAVRWLDERGVQREEIPIRQQPPTVPELQRMLAVTGDLRKLFNTSGTDYKALGMKDRLPKLTEAEALKLLSENGNLVKRPFLLTTTGGAVGFKAEQWEKLLGI